MPHLRKSEGLGYGRFRAIESAEKDQSRREKFEGWSLWDRLELLAFDARPAGVPQALLKAPWDTINKLREEEDGRHPQRAEGGAVQPAIRVLPYPVPPAPWPPAPMA
jgi:hypothetical protein